MSFLNLTRDLFEAVTINVTPRKEFISGSKTGVTGSVYLSPVRSDVLKEVRTFDEVDTAPFDDSSDVLDGIIQDIQDSAASNSNITAEVEKLFSHIENFSIPDLKSQKKIDIQRIEQPIEFATGSVIKRYIQNNLMPHYKHQYHQCGYHYTNYHTLNFFTGSGFSTGSVLIYPNRPGTAQKFGYRRNTDTAFTVQFWINPRYKNNPGDKFHAGTILHLSGAFSFSLISGSQKDNNGLVDSYKILGQFKDTASTPPHSIDFTSRSYPNELWITSSFELKHNHWHHITARWSPDANERFCELIVDSNKDTLLINSSSLGFQIRSGICIGNFFTSKGAPVGAISHFNNSNASTDEGTVFLAPSADLDEGTYGFDNPLNAEIHDIRLYNSYLLDSDLLLTGSGPTAEHFQTSPEGKSLSFYLPPFFYPETTKRKTIYDGTFRVSTSSYTPINTLFAFSKNGKEINLENFTKEMVQGAHPRLFHLTSSLSTGITSDNVDEYSFSTGSITKRNMTILPNDNGQFKPNYYVINRLSTGSLDHHFTSGSLGKSINYDLIKIENLSPSDYSSFEGIDLANSIKDDLFLVGPGTLEASARIIDQIQNVIDLNQNNPSAIAEDLKDNSSNYISIFNISNLFYGNRIHPGSFELFENEMSGSGGKIKINLKDNGRGSLYRADCKTPHAVWNSVGNIFYDEGLAIIKSPHLPLYGKDKFTTNFKGEQEIHSMIINVPAERGFLNSSSNPSFKVIPKSNHLYDENTKTIALSSVNIHDENFNIIMRANFAQPLLKSDEDEFVVRLKMDF